MAMIKNVCFCCYIGWNIRISPNPVGFHLSLRRSVLHLGIENGILRVAIHFILRPTHQF